LRGRGKLRARWRVRTGVVCAPAMSRETQRTAVASAAASFG